MSGMICPDCGLWGFEQVDEKTLRCTICGWEGPQGPRKMLYPDDQRRRAKELREKRSRREAGLLFFIRVYVSEKHSDDVAMQLLDILGVQQAIHKDEYILLEMKRRLTHEEMAKVEALPGVEKVTTY